MRRRLPRIPAMTSHERSVLVATCLSSLGSFYTMAVTGFALPQIQRGLSIPDMGPNRAPQSVGLPISCTRGSSAYP